MSLLELFTVLPVDLASGVALIVIVSVLVSAFRPFRSGEEPGYMQLVRAIVIMAVYIALGILLCLGVYIVISATFEDFSERNSVAVTRCPNVSNGQNCQPAEGNKPSHRAYGERRQPSPSQVDVSGFAGCNHHCQTNQHNDAADGYGAAEPARFAPGAFCHPGNALFLPIERSHNPGSLFQPCAAERGEYI